MTTNLPFIIKNSFRREFDIADEARRFQSASPFPHIVIDNFLPKDHATFLSQGFPRSDHKVWLDWRDRSEAQHKKLGPGDSSRFDTLDPSFRLALSEFNNSGFLTYLEDLTGVEKLIPDPYFKGGGMHQIINDGFLDIHTDFNEYVRLGIYRQLNVLIYLTDRWEERYGGSLELWDGGVADGGKCVQSIAPIFNRCVIFRTTKSSFHGHPVPWKAPDGTTRRSIAFYYYTAEKVPGERYDAATDFQKVVLPQGHHGHGKLRSLARRIKNKISG